jgi:phage minor structural protein
MFKLFQPTDKTYSTNGDKIILPVKAKVHKEDNGDYYLDVEASLDYVNDLVEGNIIVAPTPQGEQAFRITNPQKTRKKITVKAYHVFYDSKNYLIQDSYVVNKNCNDALDHLNNATDNPSPFTTLSNIGTVDSYRCVRSSLYEAVQVVLQRWGGHLVRDNWNIKILNEIGVDNGVTVRYAKNLKDITCQEYWDNVVTKLMPTGTDGIMLNDLDSSIDPYVYPSSGLTYDIPYTKTIAFEQNIDQELYQDDEGNLNEQAYKEALIADLRAQAQAYIDFNCVPQINYTLKANLEKITDIGDTVEVIDERLNLDLMTNIIAYDYDVILGKYTELEFGNFKKKLSNLTQNITNTVVEQVTVGSNNSITALETELQQAQAQIMGVLGNGYVIYDGNQILVVDNLPKETAVNVIRISNGGIGFSNTGINGNFTSAWTIDGTLNMQAINVINFTANLIKGGTLKLGSNLNESGIIELYDDANNLIGQLDRNGLKMYGQDGSYILINNQVGFAGYDRLNNKIYWVDKDEFHMKKSVVEEEITLCNKMRFIPITLESNGVITNDGIGLVSVAGG